MPVGLTEPDQLYPVVGLTLATTAASIRYTDRSDMLMISLCEGTSTAAVFTQNKYCAAPVTLARQHLSNGSIRALLINAGNANAGTGSQGMTNAIESCETVAEQLSIDVNQVMPFSTGVIGEQLPMDKVNAGIEKLPEQLHEDNWLPAAKAIMTTDTIAKGVSEKISINGQTVTITGIVKGSGMICPNMATLLSYVATDAAISQTALQSLLVKTTDKSFNRITVDSDTSTNDALVLMATGASGVSVEHSSEFEQALQRVMTSLATSVIRDAEGATKFVNIDVINGQSECECEVIAYSVAHSPLVKTALFASDPNWGRILAAIGKADVASLDVQKINISINDQALIENGEPAGSYSEEVGQAVFNQDDITITIDLAIGDSNYNVWTSDLSHEYVSINADYRS